MSAYPPAYPPPWQPPAQPRKSGLNGWQIAGIVAASIVALLVIGGIVKSGQTSSGTITYTVTSQASPGQAMVTYDTGSGSQQSTESLPWSVTLTKPNIASLVAQAGDGTGSVSCSITEGGKVLASNSSSGAGAVVTCATTT